MGVLYEVQSMVVHKEYQQSVVPNIVVKTGGLCPVYSRELIAKIPNG
jgi:hypothetical protein